MKTTLICYVLLAMMASSAWSKAIDNCGQKAADVVFVVDVSSSIWPKHFKDHVLTFLHEVVSMLSIGPADSDTRVGAVTFSDDVYLEFHLHHFLEKEKLLNRISQIKSRGGETDTHEALEMVAKTMLLPKNGARDNVAKIVIVITDGASRDKKATAAAARALRDHGAVVFAIGVGSKIDVKELNDIASQPSSEFVFEVTNFQSLPSIQGELVSRTCDVSTTTSTTASTTTTSASTTTPTTTSTRRPTTTTTRPTTTTTRPTTTRPTTTTTRPATPPATTTASIETTEDLQQDVDTVACINRPAEVYFVLDSSSSIWIEDFEQRMLNFVRDVIDIFDIGANKTRVGVITFSDAPSTIFGLESHVDKDELLKAVNEDNIKYMPGLTYTAEALQTAHENLLRESRNDVEKVIILITDGVSKNPTETLQAAAAAQEGKITVFAVGIGEDVDHEELRGVASKPSESYTFNVTDFNALSTIRAALAARTCEAAPHVKPVTPCYLNNADLLFAYDWTMIGAIASTQLINTLHSVSATFHNMSSDVTIGTLTSPACLEHFSLPFSGYEELSKQVPVLLRTHQSQMPSILKSARLTGFSAKNRYRPSARKIAVIVLDPSFTGNKKNQVVNEAIRLRQDDVEVFVITSGAQGRQVIQEMVSLPSQEHVILLPNLDFSNSASSSEKIVSALCGSNGLGPYPSPS